MKRFLFSALIPVLALAAACSNAVTFAPQQSSDNGDGTFTNPVLWSDCPDPDLIRVGDDYYLVSTTMHLMPGAPIMHSKDLVNWEVVSYIFDRLEETPYYSMEDGTVYGRGQWATSLRYKDGRFFAYFTPNDQPPKGWVYSTTDPKTEKWELYSTLPHFHDASFFFDDNGKAYMVYGTGMVRELKPDLTGVMEGGLDMQLFQRDKEENSLLEGSRMIKKDGKYYLLMISWPRGGIRRDVCYRADRIEGPYEKKVILETPFGGLGAGVAQGTIFDTPEGDWYSILFQDRGAVGRVPVLLPVYWEEDYPVFGVDGKVPQVVETESTKPEYVYMDLVQSDDFKGGVWPVEEPKATLRTTKDAWYDSFGFKSIWQFNHEPELSLVERDLEVGTVQIITDKLCANVTQARNVLTQRMLFPSCGGSVMVDGSQLMEGDYAGLCAFQGKYAQVALTKEGEQLYVVLMAKGEDENTSMGKTKDTQPPVLLEKIAVESTRVRFKIEVDFDQMKDEAYLSYDAGEGWKRIGTAQKLYFRLDHFTGCRFGLFIYATQEIGGRVTFSEFIYQK